MRISRSFNSVITINTSSDDIREKTTIHTLGTRGAVVVGSVIEVVQQEEGGGVPMGAALYAPQHQLYQLQHRVLHHAAAAVQLLR